MYCYNKCLAYLANGFKTAGCFFVATFQLDSFAETFCFFVVGKICVSYKLLFTFVIILFIFYFKNLAT